MTTEDEAISARNEERALLVDRTVHITLMQLYMKF